tara:strand:+ start:5611 stop:7173 length:1563 start_codon:yes stop_codon:yes gene_type:complete
MKNDNKSMPRIVVIGGGATGCGVARDLILRGYKTTLIEFNDLGSGTSSRFHGMLQSGARYVVSDTNYAAECYRERKIIEDLFPESVESIGGLFVSLPEDPDDYSDRFVKSCEIAKIPVEEINRNKVLNKEKNLSKKIYRALQVPDAIIHSWRLVNLIAEDIKSYGGKILTNHQVVSIKQQHNNLISVEVETKGIKKIIECDGVINASGPWSARIAKLMNQEVELELTKGCVMVFSHRLVSMAINRCRMPSSNDIMCPSGTVSLWGTTSEIVNDPNTTKINPYEIQDLLNGAEKLFPNIRDFRSFRAWAGVRPLVKDKNSEVGKPLSRSHSVIDHEINGLKNVLTVCGGSLTTHRSMAEDVVNRMGNKFGINTPCSTSYTYPLNKKETSWKPTLNYLNTEKKKNFHEVICECESVLKSEIENLIKEEKIYDFHDLRRRIRIGFGPCQGTFCNSRLADIIAKYNDNDLIDSILNFWSERLKGSVKTSYGDQAKQILLSDYIFQENFGLKLNKDNAEKDVNRI